ARPATREEAMDATVCGLFSHALYLGEVHRLATMVGACEGAGPIRGRGGGRPPATMWGRCVAADPIRERVGALTAEVERASELRVLALRPLVTVQAGGGVWAPAGARTRGG